MEMYVAFITIQIILQRLDVSTENSNIAFIVSNKFTGTGRNHRLFHFVLKKATFVYAISVPIKFWTICT